jgi:hypothetical protein
MKNSKQNNPNHKKDSKQTLSVVLSPSITENRYQGELGNELERSCQELENLSVKYSLRFYFDIELSAFSVDIKINVTGLATCVVCGCDIEYSNNDEELVFLIEEGSEKLKTNLELSNIYLIENNKISFIDIVDEQVFLLLDAHPKCKIC